MAPAPPRQTGVSSKGTPPGEEKKARAQPKDRPIQPKEVPPNTMLSIPRAAQEISFVAFEAGSSKENRKAVRVQAAKASAAARKATIARKQAQQQKSKPAVDKQQAQIPLPPSPKSPGGHAVRPAKRRRLSPEPNESRYREKQGTLDGRLVNSSSIPAGAQDTNGVQGIYGRGNGNVVSSTHYFATQHAPSRQLAPRTWLDPRLDAQSGADRPSFANHSVVPSTVHTSHQPSTPEPCDEVEEIELPLTPRSMDFPSPSRIALNRTDPFDCYPIPYQPIYDNLLHHMLTVFAPRGWPALNITRAEGLSWEHFMTQHALAEPALFLVRLLFASGDMIRLGIIDSACSLYLQNSAVKAINEALAHPSRAASDGLILAVGRIALHEACYGNRNAANSMHRPAQRRMIDMRGGMKALPFPTLVKRLMRWADRVMSMQAANKRFLPDDEDHGNETFTTQQSVKVLEEWVPQEGRALRRKISIQDLLTD
jgi:hypothetical protein